MAQTRHQLRDILPDFRAAQMSRRIQVHGPARPSIDFMALMVTPLQDILFVMIALPYRHSPTLPLVTEMLILVANS
jgi:hypothetical protein